MTVERATWPDERVTPALRVKELRAFLSKGPKCALCAAPATLARIRGGAIRGFCEAHDGRDPRVKATEARRRRLAAAIAKSPTSKKK